jgi:hypothetical protein
MSDLNTVVELPSFLNEVGSTISSTERDKLINYLARFPGDGAEIPRTGGLRKLRWISQNKGKRGGLRVIYFFYNSSAPVFLLTVYKKGEQENISPEEEKILSNLALGLKKSFKSKREGKIR